MSTIFQIHQKQPNKTQVSRVLIQISAQKINNILIQQHTLRASLPPI